MELPGFKSEIRAHQKLNSNGETEKKMNLEKGNSKRREEKSEFWGGIRQEMGTGLEMELMMEL